MDKSTTPCNSIFGVVKPFDQKSSLSSESLPSSAPSISEPMSSSLFVLTPDGFAPSYILLNDDSQKLAMTRSKLSMAGRLTGSTSKKGGRHIDTCILL